MGIDPGTRVVGYGIIETKGSGLLPVDFGAIRVKAGQDYPLRLRHIFQNLTRIVAEHQPDDLYVHLYGRGSVYD